MQLISEPIPVMAKSWRKISLDPQSWVPAGSWTQADAPLKMSNTFLHPSWKSTTVAHTQALFLDPFIHHFPGLPETF